MKNLMLDTETMGTGPTAALAAIGAVFFDPESDQIGDRFYIDVDLASSVKLGMTMDVGTVKWWLRQSDEARSAFTRQGLGVTDALGLFSHWLGQHQRPADLLVWGNGADFDNVIVATAYRLSGLSLPWAYYNNRCYRTLKTLRPEVLLQRVGTHHNAVDDAESQARHAIALLRPAATPPVITTKPKTKRSAKA